MRRKSSIVLLAMAVASSAAADARFSTGYQQASSEFRLVYAQVQIGDLSQSDMRRLVFYTDRATGTLQNFVEGSDSRSVSDQDKANKRFRESITRLADAGAKAGLSIDQVADFYTQNVIDAFGQDFIQKLDTFAGGLELRTLFGNASANQPTTAAIEGEGPIDALAVVGQDLRLETPLSEDVEVVGTVPDADAPVALPDASAVEVSIVKRVQVIDGRWEITIINGDSLSEIAAAIYGNPLSYTTILNTNSTAIRNPNVIAVGTLLVLPKP